MSRLARIAANNFNSVRYSPPTLQQRETLYRRLTPDPNWYRELQSAVTDLNASAVRAVGVEPHIRRDYLRPIYRNSLNSYPQFDSIYLRQPEVAATVPITRDETLIDEYNARRMNSGQPAGVNGYIQQDYDGSLGIFIDPRMSQGRQTKTVIHELAHNTLGHLGENVDLSTPIKEFQAEAVARGVRERLGVRSNVDIATSAAYITGHLMGLSGYGVTPKQLFATHGPRIAAAVEALAPVPAQPFKRMVPQLYEQFG